MGRPEEHSSQTPTAKTESNPNHDKIRDKRHSSSTSGTVTIKALSEIIQEDRICDCPVCDSLQHPSSGVRGQPGRWITSNARVRFRLIESSAYKGCGVCKCFVEAADVLGRFVRLEVGAQLDVGYREDAGSLYMMDAGRQGYSRDGIPEDWLWQRDRVDIYPVGSRYSVFDSCVMRAMNG